MQELPLNPICKLISWTSLPRFKKCWQKTRPPGQETKDFITLGWETKKCITNIAIMALAVIRMCTFAPVPWVSLFPQGNSKRRSRSGNPGLGIFLFFFLFSSEWNAFYFLCWGSDPAGTVRQTTGLSVSLASVSVACLLGVPPMEKTAGGVATGGEAASQSTCGLGTRKCSQAKTTFPQVSPKWWATGHWEFGEEVPWWSAWFLH